MKAKQSPFAKWLPLANRHVAFFTMIGFEDIVSDKKTNQIALFERIMEFMNAIAPIENFIGVDGGMSDLKRKSGALKCFQFFDKIILVTKDDSTEASFALDMASLLVVNHAILNGFLIKGAIATGEVIVDIEQNVCIGKAVAIANNLEKRQQWCGVSYNVSTVDDTLLDDENIREATDEDVPLATYYPVPLLDDGNIITKEMKVLNWPIFGESASMVQGAFRETDYPIHLNLNPLIERTDAFVTHSFKERNRL